MNRQFFLKVFGVAVVATWMAASAGAAVYVRVAPPRPVVERVVVRRPGAGYVWIGGYHRWLRYGYSWVPGRWALPSPPGAVRVGSRLNFVACRGYVFGCGCWRCRCSARPDRIVS